jgi:hypothetical protein
MTPTTCKLDVEGTVTTLWIEGDPYYVYEYNTDPFIDVIIRGPTGHRIDEKHPLYKAIGEAYVDSTPE